MAIQFKERPSALLGIDRAHEWICYQVDEAICAFGSVIEAALHEVDSGSDDYALKYSIEQLLDNKFKLPGHTKIDELKRLAKLEGTFKQE